MGNQAYDYGVGDTIIDPGGRTAIVSRIDPSCNNVYVVAEKRNNGEFIAEGAAHERELGAPHHWRKVLPSIEAAGFLLIWEDDGGGQTFAHGSLYGGTRLDIISLAATSYGEAKRTLERRMARADVGRYRAVAVYSDKDVDEFEITVQPPQKSVVEIQGAM